MPGGKLKSALLAHQANSARKSAEAKSGNARKAKEESMKHTAKERKKIKLARRKATTQAATSKTGPGLTDGAAESAGVGSESGPVTSKQPEDSVETSEDVLRPSTSSTAKPTIPSRRLPTIPFAPTDTVLLLGEANFSFSLSLLSLPVKHRPRPNHILATSYDDEKTCYAKYPDALENVTRLRAGGVRVEFGVDAGNLEKCKAVGKGRWSKVVFNFPHAGAGITDQDRNILTNQHLLLRTFRSVHAVLTSGPMPRPKQAAKRKPNAENDGSASENEDGDIADYEVDSLYDDENASHGDANGNLEDHKSAIHQQTFAPPHTPGTILITLLAQPPYSLWSLPQLGAKPPPLCPGTRLPQPRYTLLRSFRFDPTVYDGYEHRRTIGWKEGLSKGANEEIVGRKGEARTWEFGRREDWLVGGPGKGKGKGGKGVSKGSGSGGKGVGKDTGKKRRKMN